MEPEEQKRQQAETLFDKVLKEARERSVEKLICLQQKQTLTRSCRNNRWSTISHRVENLSMSGLAEHYDKIKELQRTSDQGEDEIMFKYLLRYGDRFPKLAGQSNPFINNISQLEHRPGEVLLILLISRWGKGVQQVLQILEKTLEKKAAEWKDSVRIVAINSAGKTPSNITNQQGQKIVWKLIEHLQLEADNKFIEDLKLAPNYPHGVLINQNGIIEMSKIYRQQSQEFIERIEEVLEGKYLKQINQESEKIDLPEVSNDRWKKYKQIVEKVLNIQNPIRLNSVILNASKVRKHSFGQKQDVVDILKIRYECTKEAMAQHSEWVKQLTAGLLPFQFQVDELVNDQEIMSLRYIEKMQKILQQHGINKPPRLMSTYVFDLRNGAAWSSQNKASYPILSYKRDCNFEEGKTINQKVLELGRGSSRFYNNPFNSDQYPWRIIGSEFPGIRGVRFREGLLSQEIQTVKGVSMIICKLSSSNKTIQEIIQTLIQLVRNNPGKIQLYLVAVQTINWNEYSIQTEGVLTCTTSSQNSDIKALGLTYTNSSGLFTVVDNQRTGNVLIVNNEGIITKLSKFQNILEINLQDYLEPRKPIKETLVEILQELPDTMLVQRLLETIRGWEYLANFKIIYTAETDSPKNIETAKLQIKVRQTHKRQFQPLIELLRPQGVQIQITSFKQFVIPEGKECTECNEPLRYPYYYFPWSNVHRCFECTEENDSNIKEKLKRYPINENSILVFAPNSSFDARRMGSNCQAKKEAEWARSHFSFMCDSCRGGARNQARYVCLGCKREPRVRDYVDFCVECAQKLRGPNELKQQVLARCPQHKENHPLLRLLFASAGYYDI